MKANVEQPDRGEAERFLARLDPTAKAFTFQTFDDNGDRKDSRLLRIRNGTLDQHWAELVKLNAKGAGVYVTINETDLRGRKTENIVRVRALFIDLDGPPLGPVLHSATPPHLVVQSSPGKYHAYRFGDDVALDQFTAMQKSLAAQFGGDNVSDLPRVMRLPGFVHRKGAPMMVRIVSIETAPPITPEPVNFYTEYGEQFHDPIDVEQALGEMTFHGKEGDGIDDTETRVSASLLLKYQPVNEAVIERVVEEIIEAVKATPGTQDFKWDREADHVRDKCLSWIKKHPEIAEPEWLKQKYPKLAAEPVKPADVVPVDLWNRPKAPPLPTGLLPAAIEDYARGQGELMGADPAGLAMGALTICATAIPDWVQLQPKRHDKGWKVSARTWTALVGPVSGMKSPMMREVARPLFRIDVELKRAYNAAKAAYEEMSKEEKKSAERPRHTRIRIEDVTPEAAQDILADSPDGVLCFRDELSGWFGSIDKYSSARGGGMDRGFWLQAYNGGTYVFDRVSRGSGLIENLSISVLGGIQPDAARRVVADGVDDGLIQRLIPVMLQTATEGRDEVSSHSEKYNNLVGQLHSSIPPQFFGELHFDDDALVIRQQLERKHLELTNLEAINKKLASHIGKYNGMFAQLCLIWHVIENYKNLWPSDVSAHTAQRVADFLHRFLLPHAVAFYNDMLGLSDDHDRLMAVVGYILAHKLEKMTSRDVQRGDRTMRGLERRDIERIFDQLEALGWVWRERHHRSDSLVAVINPEVHRLFKDHAEREAARRQRERAQIVRLLGGETE